VCSGTNVLTRACNTEYMFTVRLGCRSGTYFGYSGTACFCNTHKRNSGTIQLSPPGNGALTTTVRPSSHALTCFDCISLYSSNCRNPTSSTATCTGDICVKAKYKDAGQLSLSFTSDAFIFAYKIFIMSITN